MMRSLAVAVAVAAVLAGCGHGGDDGPQLLDPRILRRPKRGFAVGVVDGWFGEGQQGRLAELLLDPESSMYGLLRPERVRAMLDDHRSGREDHHKVLFSLVMVEEWLRSAAGTAPLRDPVGT